MGAHIEVSAIGHCHIEKEEPNPSLKPDDTGAFDAD